MNIAILSVDGKVVEVPLEYDRIPLWCHQYLDLAHNQDQCIVKSLEGHIPTFVAAMENKTVNPGREVSSQNLRPDRQSNRLWHLDRKMHRPRRKQTRKQHYNRIQRFLGPDAEGWIQVNECKPKYYHFQSMHSGN